MDHQIIKQLLHREFYNKNKDILSASLFDDAILELYEIIVETHSKFDTDISTAELLDLWKVKNPVAPNATTLAMIALINKIEAIELYDPDIASSLLEGLWKRDTGQRVARIGLAMAEGKDGSLDRLKALVERVESGFMPTDFGEDEPHDILKLLEELSDKNRFRFNIPSLTKHVYGIARGEFGVIMARPNTGKTALGISLCCAPGGYADQGLKVAILGNEEKTSKLLLRCYGAWSGMTRAEIAAAPTLAQDRFELISDKVSVRSIFGWPLSEVEAYLKYKEVDVAVVDQLDKVHIPGNYERPDMRLRELYTQSREIPKRLNNAVWGMSQASNEGNNKTIITPDMAEGSKTGKYAEADLFLGVGKYADEADGEENSTRFITVGKNKVNGWHGTIVCKIERERNRYVD